MKLELLYYYSLHGLPRDRRDQELRHLDIVSDTNLTFQPSLHLALPPPQWRLILFTGLLSFCDTSQGCG